MLVNIASSRDCRNLMLFCFTSNFCIIEGPDTVQDFVQMRLKEIQDNIQSRRNKIFLLMEEVGFLKFFSLRSSYD